MPSTYSSNLKIELMATGENANTWGTITNTNLGTALEQAIVGYGNPDFASDANLTITLSNSNSAQAARALVLNVTSSVSLTATRELVVPTIQKQYIVQNNTTGAQSVTVKTSAGTGVTVPNGRKAHLYVDGTNVVQMFDFVDINGGTIDGVSIGASSASTGAFTTVSTGNGTAGTPALNATADTNTGLYFPAADTLGLVTGGTERARVDSSGNLGVGTTAPAQRLAVRSADDSGATNIARFESNNAAQGVNVRFASVMGDGGNTTFGTLSNHAAIIATNSTEVARFDTSGNLGIGTSSPSSYGGKLNVYAGDIVLADAGTSSGASAPRIGSSTQALVFKTNSGGGSASEVARFDGSGNLGIGTTSPSARLHVGTSGGTIQLRLGNNTGSDYWGIGRDNVTTGDLVFQLQTTERMRLTASSNLGVAVVPNAWSGLNAVQVGYGTLANNNAGDYTLLSSNNYYDGTNWRYISSSTATMYRQLVGAHAWFSASSGTAGNVVSWTQAMTLDASGNLGLGSTAPVGYTGYSGVTVQNTNGGFINLRNGANTNQMEIAVDTGNTGYVKTVTAIPLTFGTNNTERMRLDSSGNLGIGTTPSGYYKFEVLGGGLLTGLNVSSGGAFNSANTATFDTNGAGAARFYSRGSNTSTVGSFQWRLQSSNGSVDTQAMTLDASGNLMVGGTGETYRISSIKNTGTSGLETNFIATNQTDSNFAISVSGSAASDKRARIGTVSNTALTFATADAERMRLDTSGNLGLGVTPSAWGSNFKAIESAGASSFAVSGANINGISILSNAYADNSNWYYTTTGPASRYAINQNIHQWFNAPSGTAGNVISFTQAMTLDASGNLGLGVTPNAWSGATAIEVSRSGNALTAFSANNLNIVSNTYFNGTNWIYAATNSANRLQLNGGTYVWDNAASGTAGTTAVFTERMRLDASGNLGIGTSSPGAKLQVGDAGSAAPIKILIRSASADTYLQSTSTGSVFGTPNNVPLLFNTNDAEKMRLDASGNLGLGVTPSAWGSSYRKAVQVGTAALAGISGTEVAELGSNWYVNSSGSAAYMTTNVATLYQQASGAHKWYTAPSGTAGNAISFTQAMTLDSSGQLMIGTTSPAGAGITIKGTYFARSADEGSVASLSADNGGATTLSAYKATGGTLTFVTANTSGNNTERARIDSSGNLLVGTTSANANLANGVQVSSTNWASAFEVTASATVGTCAALSRSTDGNVAQFYRGTAFTTLVGSISVTTTATAYNTSSDYRLKDNPQPLTNSGAFIDALQPKTWEWKADGSRGVGFIAHEAQAVSPSSVTGTKDAVDADGKPVMQAMEYGSAEFIANIVAELQSLRARVAALESN